METPSKTFSISGEKLRHLWAESKMSQTSFALAISMTKAGLYRLMQPGEQRMFNDNFRRLAQALGLTLEDLEQRVGSSPRVASVNQLDNKPIGLGGPAMTLWPVKTYHGVSAGARNERLAIEQGRVHIPENLAEFAVRVDGESMKPDFPNGSLALFESVEGACFVYGKVYLVWFDNGECYFSTVTESKDDQDRLILEKINKNRGYYPNRIIHRNEITRIAKCVGVVLMRS